MARKAKTKSRYPVQQPLCALRALRDKTIPLTTYAIRITQYEIQSVSNFSSRPCPSSVEVLLRRMDVFVAKTKSCYPV